MRMLYWNLQNITSEKYYDRDVQRVIANALLPGPGPWNDISLYVIVEVHTRAPGGRETGVIYDSAGTRGLYLIYGMLYSTNNAWRCVPPVSVGQNGFSEAVGLIYRSDRLTFTGPHVWSNAGPIPAAVLGTTSVTAPPPWNQAIAPGLTYQQATYPEPWSEYAPFNTGGMGAAPAPAPQVYYPIAMPPGFFQFPGAGNRPPVRGQFTYTNSNGVVCGLDLFAVHVSPPTAVAATANIAAIPDVAAASAPNTIRMVVGDFNVPTNGATAVAAYNGFTAAGFNAVVGGVGGFPAGTPTHFNTNNPQPYQAGPNWQYLNWVNGSIDNVFVKGNGPVVGNFAIVDQVLGAPAPWVQELQTVLGAYAVPPYGTNSFQSWNNFGHVAIRVGNGHAAQALGASDHMPIYMQFD